jgi:fucose permease
MGYFTDSISVRAALLVPLVSYLYIVFFAFKGSKTK